MGLAMLLVSADVAVVPVDVVVSVGVSYFYVYLFVLPVLPLCAFLRSLLLLLVLLGVCLLLL